MDSHQRLLVPILVLICGVTVMGQDRSTGVNSAHRKGSLVDVRDKQKVMLLVFKSRVLEVNDRERAIIEDVLKADPAPKGRHRWVYNYLAKQLNKYIQKYKSITAAADLADADYVIFFNVVEYRRILNTTYPYGELFVIVKGSPERLQPPRIVWQAPKIMFAGDAIGNFIKELKSVRGEI